MNLSIVKEILYRYKLNFEKIHYDEIYKWEAVAKFRSHFNTSENDFKEMLLGSLSGTRNLMDSGSYFPKRMLTEYLNRDPEFVRQMFDNLYNESKDLRERVQEFWQSSRDLQEKYTPGYHHFQDGRAIIVYLCMRYPEKYFLYKFQMFKKFCKLIQYPYQPNIRLRLDNILLYQNLCLQLLPEIKKDDELIMLHQKRIQSNHYPDTDYHILTQDVIYAATRYFMDITLEEDPIDIQQVFKKLIPKTVSIKLKGRFVNYAEQAWENKRLGDLGEDAILRFEQQRLKQWGLYDKHPVLKCRTEGDGLGYDILSYDKAGNEIYIEVKTTRGWETDFYITAQELQKSEDEKEQYFLYRLFDFDENSLKGKLIIRQGALTPLCVNAAVYRVSHGFEDVVEI